jgi:glutathione S-transferase
VKIHDFKGFPNPLRVRIALAEKELTGQVEFITVNVPEGEHRTPEFLAKNPLGQVPVLELDDGTCIAECSAITEYLDKLAGEPALTGSTAKQRAVIHMMQRRVEAGLLDAVGTYFHHATPGLGPMMETYQNPEWGERSRERAVACMRYLDGVLARQPFVGGEAFSVADITAFAGLVFADFARIEIPRELSHLLAWRTVVGARPSIANA